MIASNVRVVFVPGASETTEEWSNDHVRVTPEHVPSAYENAVRWVCDGFNYLLQGLSPWGELTLTIAQDAQSCTLIGDLQSSSGSKIFLAEDYLSYIRDQAVMLWGTLLKLGGVEKFVFRFKRTRITSCGAEQFQQVQVA